MKGRERMKKSKPEILCVCDTLKEANEFLRDLAHDLDKMGVPNLVFCRQRLVLETEECVLCCWLMRSHSFQGRRFPNVKYLVNHSMRYEKEFQEKIAFRLKPDVKEIKDRRKIIKLLAGSDRTEIQEGIQTHE